MQIDYYGELSRLCRESYFHFVKTFWPVISDQKLKVNWHIPYLCNELQVASERVFRGEPKEYDLICNISPGTSKSSIFTVLYTPWAWTRFPGLRFLGASFTEDLAFELTVKSRRVVQSPLYQKLFPEIELRGDLNKMSLWSNTLGGDRYAYGIKGGIMGRHAHVLGIDDPLDPQGGRSAAAQLEAARFMKETLPSRKVDKDVSFTYLVMQRISVGDPTAVMLKEYPNVKLICLPGVESDFINPPELRQHYVDGLFDPDRLSRKALADLRVQLGDWGYAGQILQQPIPPGGGAIKIDRVVKHLAPPPDKAFKKIVRAWDKAALAASGDFTVGVKLGMMDDGTIWILDIRRGQWDTDEREKIIVATAHADGRHVKIALEQELGSAGIDAAKAAVKRLNGFVVHVEKAASSGSKLVRADSLSTQINMGNIHTAIGGEVWDDYESEFMYFPDGSHDDQVDATSLAFNVLTKQTVKLGVLK